MDHQLVAVIVDDLSLTRWQSQALAELGTSSKFLLLNCTNSPLKSKRLGQSLYHWLASIAAKSPLARRIKGLNALDFEEVVSFEAETDGGRLIIPADVLDRVSARCPIVIVKFGMNLLKLPSNLNFPVLAFHHGDPRQYHSDSVAFYEMFNGRRQVDQVIYVLNSMDEGAIAAFASTRVRPYSYRATVNDVYSSSALLLQVAIRNCINGKLLSSNWNSRVLPVPSNSLVIAMVARLFVAKIRAAFDAIFRQANWEVARAGVAADITRILSAFPAELNWRVCPLPRGYQFLADPFPHPSSGILVEALRCSDQRGEILHIGEGFTRTLCKAQGHFSYPATIEYQGQQFLVPEMALWASPVIYRLSEGAAETAGLLMLNGDARLIDPTLYTNDGNIYLFANHLSETPNVLRLWVSSGLFAHFREHPSSPIRMSPSGSRMGGAIIASEGRLYRVGQESVREYGEGIILFEITDLSPSSYEEREVGELSFADLKGPHTLNFVEGEVLFDYFRVKYSVRGAVRRLRELGAKLAYSWSASDGRNTVVY